MIFLAQARQSKTYSPGDDGMRGPFYEDIVRLVEADSPQEAEEKLRREIEVDEPFALHISLDRVSIHGVIK